MPAPAAHSPQKGATKPNPAHVFHSRMLEWTALIEAEDLAGMERMLAEGMDLEAPLTHQVFKYTVANTSLGYACRNDKLAAARFLVEHGAKLKGRGKYGNMLHQAGSARIVDFLVEQGLDPAQCPTSPIEMAIRHDLPEVIVALGRHGADANWHNKDGESLMKNAVYLDQVDIVRALLDAGAKIEEWVDDNKESRGPLHHAVRMGSMGAMRVLLERGADLHAWDGDGKLPLMTLVDHAPRDAGERDVRMEMLEMFLAAGVDVLAKDEGGATAIEEAQWTGTSGGDPMGNTLAGRMQAHTDAGQLDAHTPRPGTRQRKVRL